MGEAAGDGEKKETTEEPELEQDAKPDRRKVIQAKVAFHTEDHTINCLPSTFGNMLMALSDGGFQYMLAGARANAGISAGRYMFEIKLLEALSPAEDAATKAKTPQPRNQVRIGVSTKGASQLIGECEESFCFTGEGCTLYNKTKCTLFPKLETGDVAAVVLNLQDGSPNAKTISLFVNGKRASPPQKLPEALVGKPLYPAVTFKNVSVHFNFGPSRIHDLPFVCKTLQEACAADVSVGKPQETAKDGKRQVIFPVCLPDEGTFDWLDSFLQANPHYTELSERSLLSWIEKSGLRSTKAPTAAAAELLGQKNSNDRPEMNFGIPMVDDGSIRRVLHSVAPLQQRDYVVMEVKANLTQKERKEAVALWPSGSFKRTASVMLGEPPPPLKRRCLELALKAKQEASDAAFHAKKAEEKRKKMVEQKQRHLEREKRRAERAAKKKQEALLRKSEEEKRRKEQAERGEEVTEAVDDAAQPADPADEKDSESEKEEEEQPPEQEEEAPKVQLTKEESKQWFRKTPLPDLAPYTLATSFMKFSLPEKKEEDFDEIKYDWYSEEKSKEHLKQWIRERKLSTRIEDLQPSEWFNTKWKEWQKTVQTWHAKQNAHKSAVAKKTATAAAKAAAKEAKKREAEKEAAEKAKAKEAAAEKKEGEDVEMDKAKEGKEESEKEGKAQADEEEKEEPVVDFERLDVFGVEDILDIGGGQPLFSAFAFEDWTMLGLRFELHLLVHAFRKDVNDPDRQGFNVEHLAFYYCKYYKKALNLKFFGVETIKELLEYVRDTVVICGKSQVIEALLPEQMESFGVFVMLTEESRRNRALRVDLGDESAKLRLSQQQVIPLPVPATTTTTTVSAGPRPLVTTVAANPVPGAQTWPRPVQTVAPGTISWARPQPLRAPTHVLPPVQMRPRGPAAAPAAGAWGQQQPQQQWQQGQPWRGWAQ